MADHRRLRILITRLTAIGDCVLTVPVLTALRDHFPGAFIAWAVGRSATPLLEGHAALDEIISLPPGWLKSPTIVWNLRHRLRQLKFDVTIDPQSLTKSACVCRLAGAPRRIGFAGQHGRELSGLLNNELVHHSQPHVVDRSLELLGPLGIENPQVRFDLPRYAAAEPSMNRFLRQHGLSRGFALLNVGAGWPSKLWPACRLAAVAQRLGHHHGLTSVIVWAGEEERSAAEEIVATCPHHAVLAVPTSLVELATLARQAELFVGADTGPLHLAAAVGTPCVGLYGPTRLADCGPYGDQHIALQKQFQEGGHRQRRRASNGAMQAITVADVVDACEKILARTTSHAA
ncbi:MAG: lipopolysaccharide heptosyltransferase family protein [Planctomycetales bacterium]|nr:lipopolysaccharide heptosyltransferase family protein [Planctomycetales bacterium]